MEKYFNINGSCDPQLHYMVDLSGRLKQVKEMVDAGEYFTIHKARQYGKTTMLMELEQYLKPDYEVIHLDFQTISFADFSKEEYFVSAFSNAVLTGCQMIPESVAEKLEDFAERPKEGVTLSVLFRCLLKWCKISEKKIVLMIDEVDAATNNQVFLDFLSQLRGYYLRRRQIATFHSVILAGVYDVRNIRQKIREDDEHRMNSPWNIAARFGIDMNFSADEIAGMLRAYEADVHTGMDIGAIAQLLFDYTSGYPYLVSYLCKLLDERMKSRQEQGWTKEAVLEAVKVLLNDTNPLFESLTGKLEEYPQLKKILYRMLFEGQPIAYSPDDPALAKILMFGFGKVEHGTLLIANRIFETRLYNMFLLTADEQDSQIYAQGAKLKSQFITENKTLNMELILEKFVQYFDEIYGDREEQFLEEDGRRYFMLFLKPIINGTGNYYIESRTRNNERTDMIIDYRGVQYVIEMKIWRGDAYHSRGERQLAEYLEQYHLKKGYMLSFNFNQKKQIGVKTITLGDKILVEAVV